MQDAGLGIRPFGSSRWGGAAKLKSARQASGPTVAAQPIIKPGTKRVAGTQAQRNHFAVARILGELLGTSFGPFGADKLIQNEFGHVYVSNDGHAILKELPTGHAVARMIVEMTQHLKTQVGDGVKEAVIMVGDLLAQAETLLGMGLKPAHILDGYQLAEELALEELEKLAVSEEWNDPNFLRRLAVGSLTAHSLSETRGHLADVAVEALLHCVDSDRSPPAVDLDDIRIEKKAGRSEEEALLIKGLAIDKEIPYSGMPTRVGRPKVALITFPVMPDKMKIDFRVELNRTRDIQELYEFRKSALYDIVQRVAATGANVVLCQNEIHDLALENFARRGILTLYRFKDSDIPFFAKALGATPLSNPHELSRAALGTGRIAEQVTLAGDRWIVIESDHGKACTILLRSSSYLGLAETERWIRRAIAHLRNFVVDPRVVYGGGAIEWRLATLTEKRLFAQSTKAAYAAKAYCDCLRSVVLRLFRNGGIDPLDAQIEMDYRHNGGVWAGLAWPEPRVQPVTDSVLDIVSVKRAVLTVAGEMVRMILRIDDALTARQIKGNVPTEPPEA